MKTSTIIIGADHRGFELKERLKERLKEHGYDIKDLGYFHYDPEDDYVDIAFKVAEEVVQNPTKKGVLICGSGIGVCIAANKVRGIKAGLATDIEIVKKAREDDDINVLCLPADFIDENQALALIDIFLNTEFKNQEKYLRRIKKIETYENEKRLSF